MARLKLPYLKRMRPGRWGWEPGPSARALGFRYVPLKDEFGDWLDEGRAMEAARALNAQLEAARASGRKGLPKGIERTGRSVEDLWQRYIRSSKFTRLKPKSRQDHAGKSKFFRDGFVTAFAHTREDGQTVPAGTRLGDFGEYDCRALTGPVMHAFAEDLLIHKGKHMTLGIMAVFRRTLKYAEIIGWRPKGSNPAAALELPRPAPRLRLVLPHEVEALIEAADNIGLASVGDAIVLALHSGQREMDVLSLPEKIIAAGRVLLSQTKRGAAVDIPLSPAAEARVQAARARKAALIGQDTAIAAFAADAPLVVFERTREGYRDNSQFNKQWLKVRAAACCTVPSCADIKFLDLRDTAVTRLAMSGCSKYEIAAITGHALASIDTIMKHYLVLNHAMADAAIGKLAEWMTREGIKI
ncbi:MAG: hypothetical protein D6773_08485 [Alphaproteobacteria bacterium]|nr:MAG: hypothetical protein D6773_08485 [Alphaproteobacteria bacterium]